MSDFLNASKELRKKYVEAEMNRIFKPLTKEYMVNYAEKLNNDIDHQYSYSLYNKSIFTGKITINGLQTIFKGQKYLHPTCNEILNFAVDFKNKHKYDLSIKANCAESQTEFIDFRW